MSARVVHLTRRLAAFGSAQMLVQLLQVVTGFALVRWLSVDEFAQYTLAFGVATTLSQLVDVGCSSAVMPLVGRRVHDARVFGTYVRSAFHLRTRVLAALLVPGSVLFLVLSAGHDWSWPLRIGLLVSILVAVIARASTDLYALPVLMHRRFRDYYGAQVVSGVGRLAAIGLLRVTATLSGLVASAVNTVAMVWIGFAYKRLAQRHLDPAATRDAASVREIVDVAKPLVPGIVFNALQGQVTVFLASIFGETEAIAQMGALTRIGTVFAVLGALTMVLVSPRFPQLTRAQLPGEIRRAMGLSVGAAGVLVAATFVEPSWFLLLLGPSYADLTDAIGWYMAGAAVGFLGAVLYAINVARRFIWLKGTLLSIAAIIATQIACFLTLDVSNLLDLQYFALATAIAGLLPQLVMLWLGLRRGPRHPEIGDEEAAALP